MLRLILKENSFQFNGKVFKQTHGTAHDGHKLAAAVSVADWHVLNKQNRVQANCLETLHG